MSLALRPLGALPCIGALFACGPTDPPPRAAEVALPAPSPTSATTAEPTTAAAASASSGAPVPTANCVKEECWKLGVRAEDQEQSKAFYGAGCDQGHARSCDFLAQMLREPSCQVSLGCLTAEGVKVARRACDLGAKAGCLYIAETTKETAGKADLEELYTTACDADSFIIRITACEAAGELAFARGDLEKALKISSAHCVLDKSEDVEGCILYGYMLATGQGVRKDERKGRELLTKMCKLDRQLACTRLDTLKKKP